MNNTISSDLQSRLLSLSSLVHEDRRSPDAKSSEVEEIGNTILKKIYAEDSNLPTSARLYLEQIASNIIDNKWSDIPPPVEMKFDFQKLKAVADIVALASLSTTIDIFELFRVMMEHKGNQAYNLAKIGIMDTDLALDLAEAQFAEQKVANEMQFGADIAAGATQILMGAAQIVSSTHSLKKNVELGFKTKNNANDELTVSRDKKNLDNFTKDRDELKNRYNSLEGQINRKQNEISPNSLEISKLRHDQRKIQKELDKADGLLKSESNHVDFLSSSQKKLTSDIETKTNAARYKDQLRGSVIQSVKGLLDMVGAGIKLLASNEKLEADKLESAKTMADRSANAMKEASRNASEDLKKFAQTLDGILQTLSSSVSNSLRA
jgi:predicted nuclease with TOPRIM domain